MQPEAEKNAHGTCTAHALEGSKSGERKPERCTNVCMDCPSSSFDREYFLGAVMYFVIFYFTLCSLSFSFLSLPPFLKILFLMFII
ncbi:uncharacterized protein BDW43DRAFT_275614 [Aspergillus alliaceus]|uniref:uncharacterized protein n=1 Tax=Petromyces alliaceus TaxID=209559 RepID=UPI0012A714AD|nr:uncharacterized protein BDW43DRAFT_275614 [Aspergillus alliaceus]KAB8233609.1 hypothetical protein BDW43DRAFT_275614 [Aspergillus alliaceus]